MPLDVEKAVDEKYIPLQWHLDYLELVGEKFGSRERVKHANGVGGAGNDISASLQAVRVRNGTQQHQYCEVLPFPPAFAVCVALGTLDFALLTAASTVVR